MLTASRLFRGPSYASYPTVKVLAAACFARRIAPLFAVRDIPPQVGDVPPQVGYVPPQVGDVSPQVGRLDLKKCGDFLGIKSGSEKQEAKMVASLGRENKKTIFLVASLDQKNRRTFFLVVSLGPGRPAGGCMEAYVGVRMACGHATDAYGGHKETYGSPWITIGPPWEDPHIRPCVID